MKNNNQSLETEKLRELLKQSDRTELLFSLYFYPGLFAPIAIIMLLVWLKIIESFKWELLSNPITIGYYTLFSVGAVYGLYRLASGTYEIHKFRKGIKNKN